MNRDHDGNRVPDLVLERYRLGELPPEESERLERCLAGDPVLRERLDALEISDREIRRDYPPEWLGERIRRRAGARPLETPERKTAWPRFWPVTGALAAAAIVLLMLAPRLLHLPPGDTGAAPADVPTDRIKGLQPALALFLKTEDGAKALADGDTVHAGDVIRVGYRAAGRPYGVILSIDGRGTVTVHLPRRGGSAASLRSENIVLLDGAYELDDAPRFERFFFVTSQAPFDVELVADAARRAAQNDRTQLGALPIPERFEQAAFTIEKGARP